LPVSIQGTDGLLQQLEAGQERVRGGQQLLGGMGFQRDTALALQAVDAQWDQSGRFRDAVTAT
jgi:hypothetical protein